MSSGYYFLSNLILNISNNCTAVVSISASNLQQQAPINPGGLWNCALGVVGTAPVVPVKCDAGVAVCAAVGTGEG